MSCRFDAMKTIILMDTREKTGHKAHILKAFDQLGVECVRSKLYVGDYALPADQSVCIDVKGGMQEVYSNLIQDHHRFKAECIRAHEAGIRLIILVEEPGISNVLAVKDWINPRAVEYDAIMRQSRMHTLPTGCRPKGPPVDSHRLARLMLTMTERYGVAWRFCSKDQTGEVIYKILTREIPAA